MTDTPDRLYERLLVVRSQTGDDRAFAELVERYHARLRYFLRKLLGDLHTAEDVLQNTWLDAFKSLGRLNDAGAFPAWLYRIARDRAYRELRKRRQTPFPLEENAIPNGALDAHDFAEEDVALVHEALDVLQSEHREVLVLRFLEEMSYEDIADVISCPLGTVRSRLYYAKMHLKRILEKVHEHE